MTDMIMLEGEKVGSPPNAFLRDELWHAIEETVGVSWHCLDLDLHRHHF